MQETQNAIETIYYPSNEIIPWPQFIQSIFPAVLLSHESNSGLINQYLNENYIEFTRTNGQMAQQVRWTSNLSKGLCIIWPISHTLEIIPLKCYWIDTKQENPTCTKITPLSLTSFDFQTWENPKQYGHPKNTYEYLKPERPRLNRSPLINGHCVNKTINDLYQKKSYKYNYWLIYYTLNWISIRCFKSKGSITEQIKRIKEHLDL
jgi:hypothetical protein